MTYEQLITTIIDKGARLQIDGGELARSIGAVRLRLTNGRPDAQQFAIDRFVPLRDIRQSNLDLVLMELNHMYDQLSDHLPSSVDVPL